MTEIEIVSDVRELIIEILIEEPRLRLNPKHLNRQDIQDIYDKYLYIRSELNDKHADVVLLHGSRYINEIAEVGAKLYHDKRAPYLIALGGENRITHIVEGIEIRDGLIQRGVPHDAILVGVESTDTKKNAIEARRLIETRFGRKKIERIIVVAASHHVRRAVMTDKCWVGDGKEKFVFYPCGYELTWFTRTDTLPNGEVKRFLTEQGIKAALGQYLRILNYLGVGDVEEVREIGDAYT